MLAMIAAFALATGPIPDKFSVAFIQLTQSTATDPAFRLSSQQWKDVPTSMNYAGMKTVSFWFLSSSRERISSMGPT